MNPAILRRAWIAAICVLVAAIVTASLAPQLPDAVDTLADKDGDIRPVVDRVYPLREAVAAHKAFEAGEFAGRAVLVV